LNDEAPVAEWLGGCESPISLENYIRAMEASSAAEPYACSAPVA
jgi:hypothetical protein